MKLVCITGMDGTGKTTLARSLADHLREQGIPSAYIYGRTYPIISRALMTLGRLTLLRGRDQWRDYEGYTAGKKRTMQNRLLARLYSASILLDYYPQVWLKLLPHLLGRRIVICDRYMYDTVISDLAVHLNYSTEQTDRAIELGLRLLPNPTLTALLEVPPEVAYSRKHDVPHVDYLRERHGRYLRLSARPEVKCFDGEVPPHALQRTLLREITSTAPRVLKEVSR
jgi:thymidylate kinase